MPELIREPGPVVSAHDLVTEPDAATPHHLAGEEIQSRGPLSRRERCSSSASRVRINPGMTWVAACRTMVAFAAVYPLTSTFRGAVAP